MGNSPPFWTDRANFGLDRRDPYLHLHFVVVFVRDQDRSLRFYLDQLGFALVVDYEFAPGKRWIEVAPPHGTTRLSLVRAEPGSEEAARIGGFSWIFFLTENISAKFAEWSGRGVEFQHTPEQPAWGVQFTRFKDIDGNSFGLAEFDEATKEVEGKRRALAERVEIERRAAQELEIAKQVQARLFPQRLPVRQTLDYAGLCLQARQVGGDYYDFIDLGQERLCLAIADISGKGIGAALLMANLQANLRSQAALALDEPERVLQAANKAFFDNTADSSYATLFFADYNEVTQKLRYFNCGHLPALLFRDDGSVERLASTTTVLGLFRDWECAAQTCSMGAGDMLVMYTDGVTEAADSRGEEFGEERLVEFLGDRRHHKAEEILEMLVGEVRRFSVGEQLDDITAIVARCTWSVHENR